MKQIPLSGKKGEGLFLLVDDGDYEKFGHYRWHLSTNGYPTTSTYNSETKKDKLLKLHRLIMGYPKGLTVDHINGDKLDNRRSNLRICTQAENSRNRKKPEGNNKYKGVRLQETSKRFRAVIRVNGKYISLGGYATEEEAAMAYNEAAYIYFGKFAKLNKVIL
jgi:hypothetical protein